MNNRRSNGDESRFFPHPHAAVNRFTGETCIVFGAHGDCPDDEEPLIVMATETEVFDSVAHCLGCGAHFHFQLDDEEQMDFAMWAIDVLNSGEKK